MVAITAFVGLFFLIASLVCFIIVESMVSVLFPTSPTDPMYNFTHQDPSNHPEVGVAQMRQIYLDIQYAGILIQIFYFFIGAWVVSRVKYSPLGIPFFFVIYFIGLFVSALYSNLFYNVYSEFVRNIPTFQVQSYLVWLNVNAPYLVAFFGFVMFIFAYVKAPEQRTQTSGFVVG